MITFSSTIADILEFKRQGIEEFREGEFNITIFLAEQNKILERYSVH